MKKFIATTLSGAVLLATVAPAAAQDYRATGGFAPQEDEVSATVNYRIPFGAKAEKPSVGLTLAASRADDAVDMADGRIYRPQRSLADIRFDDAGLAQAEIGGVNLASKAEQERLGFGDMEWTPKTWIFAAIIVGGLIWWAVEEGDDDDDDDNDDDD